MHWARKGLETNYSSILRLLEEQCVSGSFPCAPQSRDLNQIQVTCSSILQLEQYLTLGQGRLLPHSVHLIADVIDQRRKDTVNENATKYSANNEIVLRFTTTWLFET